MPGGSTGTQGPVLLWGSRGQYWLSRASTSGSRGQHWQSRVSTAVGVQEAALALKAQHSCGCPGGSTGTQGPALLQVSWGQHWHSRASIPVSVQGAALAVRG